MTGAEGKTRCILAIDDEPLMLTLIERILLSEGYRVLLAGDGASALSLAKEENPDLILLDIMMPGQSGFETLEKIREITNAPVIMLTGRRDTETVQKTIDAGADDFLKKPFRPNELIARIEAKLRRV